MFNLLKSTVAAGLGLVIAGGDVSAQENSSWVMAQLPNAPEGLTVDSEGTYYASLHFTGEVVRLTPDGGYEHVAWVPSQSQSGQGVLVGIEIESSNTLIAAYKGTSRYDATDSIFNPFHPSCRDATETISGVYRVFLDSGEVEAVATRADGWPFCFPDDVAIGKDGSLYLADLTYSAIWKLSPDGQDVAIWSSHPLLNWGPEPFRNAPIGVNVIAFNPDKSALYAATDGNPMILSFPLLDDGSAGEPTIIVRDIGAIDGIDVGADGTIYVSEILRNEIWAYSPDGQSRRLIANSHSAPLHGNASIAVRGEVVCTANLGFPEPDETKTARNIVCMTDTGLTRE